MKILMPLLVGLVIGISVCWRFGKARDVVETRKPTTTEESPKDTSVVGNGILDQLKCHDRVVRHGVETLILPKEVESLFGATNVDHFISNFGSKTHVPIWNSVTYFAGRYELSLQVPISIDYEKCRLNGAVNSATVQINEVIKVEIGTSGIAGAIEHGQWRLNENEWKWLVRNGGDWSVVHVPIQTNTPVKGFDEFVRQGREPIRNRKEGFDNPIKQALEVLRAQKGGTNAQGSLQEPNR